MSATASLLEVFSQLDDPRKPREVRYPFAGIVSLTLLGMLARIREMEVLVRWATVHWEPLGFDRDEPPCATTNEPALLRRKLRGLLVFYPMLQLITGDAMFAHTPSSFVHRRLETSLRKAKLNRLDFHTSRVEVVQ